MKRKIIGSLLILCLIFAFCACGNSEAKNAAAAGQTALASGNYEEAAKQYGFALDNGYKDEEVQKQFDTLTSYLEAKDYLETGDIENARASVEDIDTSVVEGMEESVILLEAEIGVREEEITANDATLLIIKHLIENGHYTEAEEAITEVSGKNLSESQKDQLDVLRSNLSSLSSVANQATDDDASQADQMSGFTSLDAFNSANNYILTAANSNTTYSQYTAINSVEGPYTNDKGVKYFIVPIGIQNGSSTSVQFYINVYADGSVKEYDY